MEKQIFGILVLSGLLYLSSSSHLLRVYYFINNPKTWPEAQQYCRDTYTDLATVSDWADTYKLSSLMTASVPYVFMGLCRNWGWSVPDVNGYKEAALTYSNWGSAPGWQLLCGKMTGTGQWFAIDCSSTLFFFCYNESATNIAERFTLIETLQTWDVAQNYCISLYTDLAKIQNQLENAQLQMMLDGGDAWIGLTGLSWQWSDYSIPSFIPWKPQEPMLGGVLDCTALHFGGTSFGMLDANCYTPETFFCYSAAEARQRVRLQLNSSADMKDPAVIMSILRQIEEMLRKAAGSLYVNLMWTKLPEAQHETQAKETAC
ncbi:C-type mannose receptor 2-like [Betta splendens]|uniref:C-type mannose receptor 2-like n=1 Tax=Betta splendens TaxID=158456 RepID=A0A9W2XMY6_BETSP|nr:C-type mannose receptor 2-like [Betta splendens]